MTTGDTLVTGATGKPSVGVKFGVYEKPLDMDKYLDPSLTVETSKSAS